MRNEEIMMPVIETWIRSLMRENEIPGKNTETDDCIEQK